MGSLNMAGDVSVGTNYRDARRALTAARVTVFSIDITLADAHSLAFGLQQIARDTGGFYASSIDFPDRPMRWLSGALSGYYVLFVDRPEHADAARAVTVTLTRRDALRVRDQQLFECCSVARSLADVFGFRSLL